MIRALILMFVASSAGAQERDLSPYMTGLPGCYADEVNAEICIGRFADFCMEGEPQGQTTVGIVSCILAENVAWDRLLNQEYQVAMAAAKAADAADAATSPQFANRADALRDAQRAWITFRDADCALDYARWGAGSMRQIAAANCLLGMTAERTMHLGTLFGDMQ